MSDLSLENEFSAMSATEAAARLIGCEIVRTIANQQLIGRIVETEAYDQGDPASHSYRGETPRNSVMFGPAGRLYVYFTYGMHYCMNVVVGPSGYGAAVLIRALEPVAGQNIMYLNRNISDPRQLLNGPAKLTQALAINKQFNGHNLAIAPLKLKLNPVLANSDISWSRRIGIKEAPEDIRLWRASLKGSSYLSK